MWGSIRRRLTLWYVAVLAATLVALGLAAFFLMRAELYDWLDDMLIERSSMLAGRVRIGDSQPASLSAAERDQAGDVWMLVDDAHHLLQVGSPEAPMLARAPAVAAAFDGRAHTGTVFPHWLHPWRVAAFPVVREGSVRAVVVVARDLSELHDVLKRLALVLMALIPVALAGAGIGGMALAGRALRPVDEITVAAAAISERDLSRRLPVSTHDELGRLAATFNGLIERLAQALERQRRFTADASHELRTPLSIVRALTSQQLMHPRSNRDYERALRQIDDAAGYMSKLVSHLLTLARADSGQAHLESERIDLSELLGQICAQVGEASGRPIAAVAPEPVPVLGDAVYLTGLFLNLVENAVKYSADGSVEVIVSRQDGAARVEVRDRGVGIAAEHLPHIFERFYRVDKARSREAGGSGLGLAIGRWVAEAHGGAIQAESQPGEGTTMTVTLPLAGEP